MHENSVPARFFDPRRDPLRKNFEVRRSPPEIILVISEKDPYLFERRDVHIQA